MHFLSSSDHIGKIKIKKLLLTFGLIIGYIGIELGIKNGTI